MIDMPKTGYRIPETGSRVPFDPNPGGYNPGGKVPGDTATGGTTPTNTTNTWDPRGTFGTKQWNQWNYTGEHGIDPTQMQEAWYRNPSWAPHNIWNEQYGMQNIKDIEKLYGSGGDLSGLTPQMGASFAGSKPQGWQPNQGRGGGTGVNTGDFNWQDIFNQPQGEGGQGWTQGGTMQPTEFPYPQQWGTASDVFTRFAQGLPTDTGAWWDAQQAPMERRISDQAKQMAEQMGLGGLRYSTPMTHQIADITGRETANLYGQLADRQLGLTEAAKNRGMQAAGGLTGLGQQYLNAPQQWAQQMYNMGAGMTGLGQQAYDRSYQDWMRQTAEQNPWLQNAMAFVGMPSQTAPQQYNPSFMSQFLQTIFG